MNRTLDMNRTYILFLVFTIFAFTACTGTEEQLQQLVEDEAIVPIESAPQPPAVIPSDLPVTSTVVSETPVVPPLVSDPPVEEPVVEPDPPPAPYYAPNTVYIKLSAGASSEAQARGIAQRYTVKSGIAKASSGFTGYHSTVQEGGIFRVRIDMEGQSLGGVEIVDGGCTLHMHDSHGYSEQKSGVLNSTTFSTTHDNHDDDDRTALITILTCNLPDLDREGIRYEIDRNNFNHQATVRITTAGSLDGPIDDGVYTLTMANLEVEGIEHSFDFVVDNLPPDGVSVNLRWDWTIVYHDVPSSRQPDAGGFLGLYRYVDGNWRYGNGGVWDVRATSFDEDRAYNWYWDMYWWPTDIDKTLTVTVTGFAKQPSLQPGGGYYTPPGGTYSVGEPRSMTIFVPAEVEQ